MIGTKIDKPITDYDAYAELAAWCNANNAHIEDKGTYYEVCENVVPEPTKEEQLNALVAQYESDKAEILKYYSDAMIHGDSDLMAELKEEMTELDSWYDKEYAKIEGSNE